MRVLNDEQVADEILKLGWMDDNEAYAAAMETLALIRKRGLIAQAGGWIDDH